MASPEHIQQLGDVEILVAAYQAALQASREANLLAAAATELARERTADCIRSAGVLRMYGIDPADILVKPMPEHLAGPADDAPISPIDSQQLAS